MIGILLLGAFLFYGWGATRMGTSGASVGWATYMYMTIMTANVWGLLTREWRGAPRQAYFLLASGLAVILAAIILVAAANAKL